MKTPENKFRSATRGNNYSRYYIQDGKHIGDYEGMYRDCRDPWNHMSEHHELDTDRQIAFSWMNRLRRQYGSCRVVEYGCGLGHLTKKIKDEGLSVVGIDIAKTAIFRARENYPDCIFVCGRLSDDSLLWQFCPDVIFLAHVTWCALDELDSFISNSRKYASSRETPTFLIHLLETYPVGVQKYGTEKFTNIDQILDYFNLDYIEHGQVNHQDSTRNKLSTFSTYFVARI